MISTYSFDLYGNLLKIDTSEEMIDMGHNLIRPVPTLTKGINVELETEDERLWGIIDDVSYFPPNRAGDRAVHIFVRLLSTTAKRDENDS